LPSAWPGPPVLQGTMSHESCIVPATSILLVAADPALRASLAEQLASDGHYSVQAKDKLPLAHQIDDDICITIIAHPDPAMDLSGLPAPLALHRPNHPVPEGALAALPLPVRIGELLAELARLTALPRPIDLGRFRFHPAAKLLIDPQNGKSIRLTEKEAAILDHLAQAGAIVERQTLLSEIWGYNARVTTHTLETHIYRLRQKIERDPGQAELLVNRDGGYILVR